MQTNDSVLSDINFSDLPPATSLKENLPQTAIAGFWRRFFAWFIDFFLITILTGLIVFPFSEIIFTLGPWANVISAIFIICYWGVFNSEIVFGQTIGKKVVGIAVVNPDNQYLTLKQSFLRAFLLGFFVLSSGITAVLIHNIFMESILGALTLAGGLITTYGLIFNLTTRQGAHDLLVKSYVVKLPIHPESEPPALPNIHRNISLGLAGLVVVLSLTISLFLPYLPVFGGIEDNAWTELLEVQTILQENDNFFAVGIQRNNTSNIGEATVVKSLNIELWVKTSCSSKPNECKELMSEAAQVAIDNYEGINELNRLNVTAVNQFSVGFFNSHYSNTLSYTIEEWRDYLATNNDNK